MITSRLITFQGCLITGCLNRGSCLYDEKKQTFSCLCTPPWTGEKCEIGKTEPCVGCTCFCFFGSAYFSAYYIRSYFNGLFQVFILNIHKLKSCLGSALA